MRQVLNTLYIMTQGAYVHLQRETLKVDVEKKTLKKLPMHHIGGLVLFGNVMVSPFAMHRCAEDGRSVVFMTEFGRFKARLEGSQSGNVLLRRAQHHFLDHSEQMIPLVQTILAGKLQNSRTLLMRGARETTSTEDANKLRETASHFAASLKKLPQTEELDALRGIEGNAARIYFSAMNSMIRVNREDFLMEGRNRRPPRDRINALLSFLYALLTNDCASVLESVGLDPQVGYLHALRPGRPSLALDLMEEFRPVLADRLALTLINRQQIQASDFEERPGGAVLLNEKGRRTVLTAWQKRKEDELKHESLKEQIPLGLTPFLQAKLLARTIRGEDTVYTPFMPR